MTASSSLLKTLIIPVFVGCGALLLTHLSYTSRKAKVESIGLVYNVKRPNYVAIFLGACILTYMAMRVFAPEKVVSAGGGGTTEGAPPNMEEVLSYMDRGFPDF